MSQSRDGAKYDLPRDLQIPALETFGFNDSKEQ